jgi:NADPH:quinone reductase-like Zn-dependent oxidoreductase
MQNKRVIVPNYGDAHVLQVVEDEIPQPQPGQVRVKVLAAGVAYGDILRRRGVFAPKPPFTPGYDLVGIVDHLGGGVSSDYQGQMVAALPITGGYAEYICLPVTELAPLPEDVDPALAVCLVLNYVTAYQILHRAAQVKTGERILVHGAAGGVGSALLQLAQLESLEVFGTASSPKHALVSNLGATPIDYRNQDFVESIKSLTGEGVDVVCDPLGGSSLLRSIKTLRPGGRLITFGMQNILGEGKLSTLGNTIYAFLVNLVTRKRSVRIYNITRPKYSSLEWCLQDLSKLLHLWTQDRLAPILAERIPLVEAVRAHELFEGGSVVGKIVLIPGEK